MAEKVGEIYYNATIETKDAIKGQRELEQSVEKTSKSMSGLTASIKPMAVAISGLASALSAVGVASALAADDFRLLAARVEVSAGSVSLGADAFEELYRIAQKTQTPLEASTDVFNRLNQSILQMGGNQNDTLRMTELLAKAIKTSGASATEAKSAMLQFGQAMGSGKLAGDELRALMETSPYLMRQLANSLGVPIGALKQLGADGKLTADVVATALGKAAAQIEKDFSKMPQTVGGAFDVVQNAAAKLNERMDNATGFSAVLTGALQGLGQVLDSVANQFGRVDKETGNVTRNSQIKEWAEKSGIAISYLVDGLDFIARGFTVVGKLIGGVAAEAVAIAKGDLKEAAAIEKAWFEDLKNVNVTQLAGSRYRQQAEALKLVEKDIGDAAERQRLGLTKSLTTTLKAPTVEEPKSKFNYAAYFSGLVSESTTASEKITQHRIAEEAKLDKMRKEGALKPGEYEKAHTQILANETAARAKLEEEELTKRESDLRDFFSWYDERLQAQSKAQTDLAKEMAAVNAETVAAMQKGGGLNTGEAEIAAVKATNAKKLEDQKKALEDGFITDKQYADYRIALEQNTAAKTTQIRQDAEVKLRGLVDPTAQLTADYQAKIALVEQYETMMAQRGVDIHAQAEAAKASISTTYEAQRKASQEAYFASQSVGNAMMMSSLTALGSSATTAFTGLIKQTTTARQAANMLGDAVLNSVVGSLMQMGIQYLKNMIIGQTASAAAAAGAVATGSAMAAAYAPAAALASLASFGANAAPAMAGMTATSALSTALAIPGRRYGGPTSADSLYQVNETGVPEMWTANNGKQYMMTGSQGGSVTPANKINSGVSIVINNNAPGVDVSAQSSSDGKMIEIAVNTTIAKINDMAANNTGSFHNAMKTGYTLQGRTR